MTSWKMPTTIPSTYSTMKCGIRMMYLTKMPMIGIAQKRLLDSGRGIAMSPGASMLKAG